MLGDYSIECEVDKPTPLNIAARIDAQEDLLSGILNGIVEAVEQRINQQEALLKPVYRALTRCAKERVSHQDTLLTPVGRRCITNLRSRVGYTGSLLNHVVSDLPADMQSSINANLVQPIGISDGATGISGNVQSPNLDGGFSSGQMVSNAAENLPQSAPNARRNIIGSNGTGIVYGANDTPFSQATPNELQMPANTEGTGIEYVNLQSPNFRDGVSGGGGTSGGGGASIEVETGPVPGIYPVTSLVDRTDAPPKAPIVAGVAAVVYPPTFIDWCTTNPCEFADEQIKKLQRSLLTTTTEQPPDSDLLTVAIGYLGNTIAGAGWDFAKRFIPGDSISNVAVGAGESIGRMTVGVQTAQAILRDIAPSGVRDKKVASALMARIGAGNMVANETGIPISYLLQSDQYLLQYSNPQYIPSQDELDRAYITGDITIEQWYCYTKANGNLTNCRLPIINSQRSKLDTLALIGLYRRGIIPDLRELNKRMRELGFTKTSDVEDLVKATEIGPSPSVITHWNIRDVFDPQKLGRKEMLAEYDTQVGLKELYKAIGMEHFTYVNDKGEVVKVDNAVNDWIASYEEPSPTQTYEGLHRLRPNRVGAFSQIVPGIKPDALRTILPGTDIKATADGSGSIVTPRPVTLYDVAKNLKEKDYNPYWRAMLASISYRTIGRIDLRRMYSVGVFGIPMGARGYIRRENGTYDPIAVAESELVERMLDLGYTKSDAGALAYYTSIEYDRTNNKQGRNATLSKICKSFKVGIVGKDKAIEQVTKIVGSPKEANAIVEQCELDHKIKLAGTYVSSVRKRYLDGIINAKEADGELVKGGIDRQRIKEHLDLWKLQLRLRNKELTSQQLCGMYAGGIIDRARFKKRLLNIGFDEADADRIIKHCELGELAKSAKLRDRQLRAVERERLRRLTNAEREEKAAQQASTRSFERFLKFRSEKHLKEWWQDGSITTGQVKQTLIAKGASNDDAERWIRTNLRGPGSGSGSGAKP